jgi:hypothetical protein
VIPVAAVYDRRRDVPVERLLTGGGRRAVFTGAKSKGKNQKAKTLIVVCCPLMADG